MRKLSYILHSERINKFLIAEYRRRRILIERIKSDKIVMDEKKEISFIHKSHFPYQGTLGRIYSELTSEAKPGTLIFFIAGDTAGGEMQGYYSEQESMFKLHKNSFDNTVKSNTKEMFHFVGINLKKDDTEKIFTDIVNDISTKELEKDKKSIEKDLNEEAMENELLLFLVKAALNFRFWIDKDRYWGVKGKGSSILFEKLAEMFAEMLENKVTYLTYFNQLGYEGFKKRVTLEGMGAVPDVKIRYDFIINIGNKLKEKNMNMVDFIKEGNNDAIKIIYDLNETFSGFEKCLDIFNDSIEYKGENILVAKKATYFIKLLVWSGKYELKNLEYMNVLADYKIPQYLRHQNIFNYRYELQTYVDNGTPLPKDSLMEKEIRLATVQFAKVLQAYAKNKNHSLTMLDIDEYIWKKSQMMKEEEETPLPFHLVETTKY